MGKNIYDKVEIAGDPIHLNEQLPLHIKAWKAQRGGWFLIAIFLLLAIGGLFGEGPLSYTSITNMDDTLQYERFGRFQGHLYLKFTLHKETGTTTIAFSQDYLDNFQIERIFPAAERTEVINQQIVYTFNATQKGKISFYMIPQKAGMAKGSIRINGNSFHISQFIYP